MRDYQNKKRTPYHSTKGDPPPNGLQVVHQISLFWNHSLCHFSFLLDLLELLLVDRIVIYHHRRIRIRRKSERRRARPKRREKENEADLASHPRERVGPSSLSLVAALPPTSVTSVWSAK
jgi:hypothetical protein